MSSDKKDVLVTGGVGFIGSHIIIELVNSGYNPIVIDNLNNSKLECLKRVEKIVGRQVEFIQCDLLDMCSLDKVFKMHPNIMYVIHLAALKSVGESVAYPLRYYKNNLLCAMNLLQCMQDNNVSRFIFSSSATVYGEPKELPIHESFPIGNCSNPYGKSKYFVEEMLVDLHRSAPDFWQIVVLRYFNPVGAHPSGLIGEDPCGVPNNLMPFISQVAVGIRPEVRVFGNDFNTPDGTGVRDYIHVVDLAKGHVAALSIYAKEKIGLKVYNLGTGRGLSVLELIAGMEKASGKKIPYKIVERRAGDLAEVYSSTDLANKELGWKAQYNLEDMCNHSWLWQSKNPNGFGDN